jgi:ABC-type transport system substrate-binding protein
MEWIEKAACVVQHRGPRGTPVGSIQVAAFDWLWITYNTVEELVRVRPAGNIEPAAMARYRRADDRTLEIRLRTDDRFPDGEPITAETVQRAFDEQQRWRAPHPPGTQFNLDSGTRCEVSGEHDVRLRFLEPDGLALGKLRAMHLMSTRFWQEVGFGYARNGSDEGHW